MNKQELIERYKTKYAEEPKDWKHPSVNASRQDLFANFIRDLEQLDEPQKPVVPKFVADWFEDNKDALDLAIFMAIRELDDEEWPHKTDFENWLDVAKNKPIETLIRMKDGYEVEKEPLYTVELPSMTPSKLVFDEDYCKYKIVGDYTVGRLRHHLTEKEIKYFDERYWAFAVPVEEVAER